MMKKKAIDFKNQTPSGEGVNWSYETQFKVMKKLFLRDKVTKTSKKTS